MVFSPCLIVLLPCFGFPFDPLRVEVSAGPLQVEVQKVANVLDVGSGVRHTRIQLGLSWKENFKPIFLDTVVQEMAAKAQGTAVVEPKRAGAIWSPVESLRKSNLEAVLPQLRNYSEMEFSGKIRMIVPVGWQELDLGSVKQSSEKPDSLPPVLWKNGFSVRVARVTVKPNRLSIQVDTKLPAGGPELDTNQNWAILNELMLAGPGGKNLKPQGQVLDLLESDRAMITHHFLFKAGNEITGEGWRIVYKTPSGIQMQEYPFKFPALPLP